MTNPVGAPKGSRNASKPAGDRRSVTIPIRLTAKEHAKWIAAANGIPISKWARDKINAAKPTTVKSRRPIIRWEEKLQSAGESGLREWWMSLSATEKRQSAKDNGAPRKILDIEVVIQMARSRHSRGMAFLS